VIRDRIGVEHQIDLTPRSNPLERLLGATAEEFGSAVTGIKNEPARPMMLP